MMPSLRERPGDIHLLFRKFATDFADKYGVARVVLTEDAVIALKKYRWPGNIRQLKNVAETVSAIESAKCPSRADKCEVNAETLRQYLPNQDENLLPATVEKGQDTFRNPEEREAIIRAIYQLRQDVDYLKGVILKGGAVQQTAPALASPQDPLDITENGNDAPMRHDFSQPELGNHGFGTHDGMAHRWDSHVGGPMQDDMEPEEQGLVEDANQDISLKKLSMELIEKALKKHDGNRKAAAAELGISERTLYRKIKQQNS